MSHLGHVAKKALGSRPSCLVVVGAPGPLNSYALIRAVFWKALTPDSRA
jgi:hypothetical protein